MVGTCRQVKPIEGEGSVGLGRVGTGSLVRSHKNKNKKETMQTKKSGQFFRRSSRNENEKADKDDEEVAVAAQSRQLARCLLSLLCCGECTTHFFPGKNPFERALNLFS